MRTIVLSSLCLASLASADPDPARRRVEAHVRFLADDLLEGRGTPSKGLDTAALYLANQLRSYGWEPASTEGYFQRYAIREYATPASAVQVRFNGVALAPSEYIFLPFGTAPSDVSRRFDVTFAGHAVVWPERSVDQLAGADLRGKAVIALRGAPWPLEAGLFGPDHLAGKAIEIGARDAGLFVYVTDEMTQADPGPEVGFARSFAQVPIAFLPGLRGRTAAIGPTLVLRPSAFDRAFAKASGATYAQHQKQLAAGGSRAAALAGSIEIRVSSKPIDGSAANVVAVLRGSDPVLRNEWVLLTAHYDHLGRVPGPGKDVIFNGADDNASGTAAMLEIAQRLGGTPAPKRSVMVLFTSGEERGLLGSAHYAANPLAPFDQVVANINVDMVGHSDGTVQGIAEMSDELFRRAVEAGKRRQITVQPSQNPSWRLTYLTDSYHFARMGVPAIEFFTGMHEHYHQLSDHPDTIRYETLGRIVDVMHELARSLAMGAPRPAYRRPAWFVTPS
jgi:hypothetical protein